jgi:hypothetical protein
MQKTRRPERRRITLAVSPKKIVEKRKHNVRSGTRGEVRLRRTIRRGSKCVTAGDHFPWPTVQSDLRSLQNWFLNVTSRWHSAMTKLRR